MKLSEIQELIKFVSRSGVTEVELELKDFKINIKTPARKKRGGLIDADPPLEGQTIIAVPEVKAPAAAPVVIAPPPEQEKALETADSATNAASDDSKYLTIKSPMIGTFYRASAPDKPPFASVGDDIKEGDVICIVEAMKLFNEIEAEISGKIVKVLVDDSTPVEYDQPIFLVEPH